MNRGFKTYFSKGSNLTFYSLKKASFRTKLCIFAYMVVSLGLRLFFLTRPLIAIADENMATMIIETRNISFEKMFCGLTKKRYVDMVFAYLVGDLLAIVAFGIIAVAPCMLLMTLCPSVVSTILHFVFAIIGAIFFFAIAINEYPVSYIASKTSDLEVSDYLFNSKSMNKGEKLVVLFNNVIYGTIQFVFSLVIYLVIKYLPAIEVLAIREIVIIVGLVVFVLLHYLLIMRLLVAWRVSNRLLFTDVISIKKQVVVKPLSGQGLKYGPVFVDDESQKEIVDLNSKEGDK